MTDESPIRLFGKKTTQFIPQAEAAECGLACLTMIASHFGYDTDINVLRRRYGTSVRGATLADLSEIASKMGLNTRALRCEVSELDALIKPTILHWNVSHFVVLTKVTGSGTRRRYEVLDPAKGKQRLSFDTVNEAFSGVVLECEPGPEFKAKRDRAEVQLRTLWSSAKGVPTNLVVSIVLSLMVTLSTLAFPVLTQVIVDSILPAADRDLLLIITIGFALLAVFGLIAGWARGIVMAALTNSLTFQATRNLFRHLIALPPEWFTRRHVGDIASRFTSTLPVAQLASQGIIAGVIDGVFGVATLVIMYVYSPILASISVAFVLIYALSRLAFMKSLELANVDAISTAARENTIFLETVRGISAIKAAGAETGRFEQWQGAKARAVNASLRLARITATFDAVAKFVPNIERLIFLYVGVLMVLNAQLTLGMLFAIQAYKSNFTDSSIRLVEQTVNLRMIKVHMGRISDVALADAPSRNDNDRDLYAVPDRPDLELRGVRYRYSGTEPEVLSGLSMKVAYGEAVSIIGPSGGGKSTLVKILGGLLSPQFGDVLLGGRPLSAYGDNNIRSNIAIVGQDDMMVSGTIAENIHFHSGEFSLQNIEAAAKAVDIYDTIMSWPLGFNTFVGDMGSALSGGQRQKILIARALHRKPKIVILDEATANLDPPSENVVQKRIRESGITLINVSHNLAKTGAHGRVIVVINGRAQEAVADASREPLDQKALRPTSAS